MTSPSVPSLERISAVLSFLDEANRLKDTLRSGRTPEGRQESTAEHSWRLCLLVTLLAGELEGVDVLRLLKICIVHDLGEAISGDVPAIHQRAGDDRAARERADLLTLCAPLPEDLRAEIVALWDEYAEAASPEAILAKGFDKIETMLTHSTGKNDADFDYRFNLGYGVAATSRHPLLAALRAQVDDRHLRILERRAAD
ncbi:MAG: HD domain-containing protein [Hoeflea sp.]|uniref:HD domain-containing protein n=1 Tax=Hoeflea sp. TaxID=1940281 RepID=UPI00272EF952|nr:HD domain-containing protein [Hoeflea sp.]MDP2119320.1 HD domain-containing protein [Hoeflea sp.]MDP3527222.1 HD domain-containing protein [Hoeflea sp.]